MYKRRLTSDEINVMPLVHYEGPVTLVRFQADLERVLPALRREPVLGFDTETRPTFHKGRVNLPSLIQLATAGHVYLIQLSWLALGAELASVFADPQQIKAGVGIADDMRALARLHRFTPAGLVDIGQIAEKHQIWSQGLRTMCANFFGERISKGSQCSNWALRELSPRQIAYAATDAWMGRRLFMKMRELGLVDDLQNPL